MGVLVPGHEPPKSVPGTFNPPLPPVNRMRAVRQPGWRTVTVPHPSTLRDIAARFYSDPQQALRIFNDNRHTRTMPDGSSGILRDQNQIVQAGQTLWLS